MKVITCSDKPTEIYKPVSLSSVELYHGYQLIALEFMPATLLFGLLLFISSALFSAAATV